MKSNRSYSLSVAGTEVQRHDRDRFATCLFAPSDRREALFALYAFNSQLARAREQVSEPILGRMRLQWWRDVIDGIFGGEGAPAGHPVAEALAAAMAAHRLPREAFERLLDARERDMESNSPLENRADLYAYADGTAAALQTLALGILGAPAEASQGAARRVGMAWALTGLLRAVPFHASQGRVYMPRSELAAAGLDPDRLRPGDADALRPMAKALGEDASRHLREARALRCEVDRAALPALLLAVLADGYLAQLARCDFNVFDPRVALPRPRPVRMAMAAATGRY